MVKKLELQSLQQTTKNNYTNNKIVKEEVFVVKDKKEYYTTLQGVSIVVNVVIKKFATTVVQLRNFLSSCLVVELVVCSACSWRNVVGWKM